MGRKITIGVGAVIEDDVGRVLLVRHRRERAGYWQGKWICPGGELEFGESIEDGILREVREETQLRIELVRPLLPFDRIAWSKGEPYLHVIYIDYLARVIGGEVRTGGDVGEAMWIEKRRIPEIWQDLHEDTRRLLQRAGVVPR